jgi:hypothetical protein
VFTARYELDFLYAVHLKYSLTIDCAMIQAVSLRPLTTEAWIRSQGSTCDICGGQSGTGTGFSPSAMYIGFPTMFHDHFRQYVAVTRRTSGRSNCLWEIEKQWMGN